MSRISYKNGMYTLSQLIDLRGLSPFYKSGEAIDQSDGETCDIDGIDIWRDKYMNELIPHKERQKMLVKSEKIKNIKLLERKYSENRITKDELLSLIKYQKSDYLQVNYGDFFFVNAKKGKPASISVSDYGRFMLLLDLMSFGNKVKHKTNHKQLKESIILEKLKINSKKTLSNLLTKLSKCGMLAKSGYGEKRFIHINPAYAKRTIQIDQTIYDLFNEDLKEFLSEYEIKYFEMETGENHTDATAEIISDIEER